MRVYSSILEGYLQPGGFLDIAGKPFLPFPPVRSGISDVLYLYLSVFKWKQRPEGGKRPLWWWWLLGLVNVHCGGGGC